ncbi:mucoidy inhibitor MuiA family protein [Rhodoplanes sp. Z2-YC6860]|uniref:mucoidy inhibitor MuiA family protein n=1 Tax=Rhodoplanes sp. Z2-YC6860 TaxID=674703 RepID=UPI00078CA3C5|nr:mucoidy inhibitor MuiA family protein [Rhodoplanes sp. Z2-YC6860]AMN44404.1 mucoidy inhibitor A [Rhodoplanes sp. Z2-YC6860]
MRHTLLSFVSVFAIAAAVPAMAAELEAGSQVDAVTVYPDGATVTRLIKLDLPAGDSTLLAKDFPLTLDPSSLRVEGEGGAHLVIGAVEARQPLPQPAANIPEIDRKLETLRDERATLDGAIASATARRKFAESFAESSPKGLGEKGEARPLTEWRAAFAAVGEEIANADTAIREAKIKQRDLDREIARLEAGRNMTPPKKLEVRIALNSDAVAPAVLRVTYAVRGARWQPVYDARLDTGGKDAKPSLELVRRAEITQTTGEDWSDVALAVSTMRVARGGSAPELRPWIVRYQAPPTPYAGAMVRDQLAPAAPPAVLARRAEDGQLRKAEEQQAVVDMGGFQVVFRVPGRIAVPAGQGSKSFRLASATIAPDLMAHAVPALNEAAYLQASFKHGEDAPLLPGPVSVYRDGVFVGKSPLSLASKDETVRLGFGVDEKVKVARTVVRRNEGTAGIISSSKTDEREFKTTVRNGHDFPIKVAIEDQIPVSEAEDIQVEMLPVTTPPTTRDLRDRRGVMEWAFEAKPGESREIKLGWRLRWPKDKAIQFTPQGS